MRRSLSATITGPAVVLLVGVPRTLLAVTELFDLRRKAGSSPS